MRFDFVGFLQYLLMIYDLLSHCSRLNLGCIYNYAITTPSHPSAAVPGRASHETYDRLSTWALGRLDS